MRIVVDSQEVRSLAQRRSAIATLTMPLFVLVGALALLLSLSLALVGVLCAFFAYACLTIAAKQRRVAADGTSLELELEGDQLRVNGHAPRPVLRAIDRPGYVRLMSTREWAARFWFDNRRDPSAFIDVPLPRDRRASLRQTLEGAGIPIRYESSAGRALALAWALVLTLGGFFVAKVVLNLSAAVIAAAPAAYLIVLVAAGLVIWAWRRT